jgi:K+ transporter
MKLSYFPQLKVIHTSKIFHGQLYIPLANWLLMIGTILIASIYNNVKPSHFSSLCLFYSLTIFSRQHPSATHTVSASCS